MMKNVSKAQADRIFKSCDTSGDDRISLEEFRTMLNKAPNMGGAGKEGKGNGVKIFRSKSGIALLIFLY